MANQETVLRKRLPSDITDDEIESLLEVAKMAILNKRYPFQDFPKNKDGSIADVEDRYLDLQIRIAVELYSKAGAEGEVAHSENGISRTYERANISPSLINEVIPKGRVIG